MKDTFYVTSAIYYVNDVPHVGHSYEIVVCDLIARYHRLKGERVFFLSGSDEHSQNVVKAAAKRGLTPQAWTDQVVPVWQETWKKLDVTYDDWIRTSEPRHVERVQKFVQILYDRGDIYLGTYEGPYCPSCEEFKQESELLEGGLCPIHRIPVQWQREEENYFFRLSSYQERLLQLYDRHPEFVLPETRRNEVVAFVKGGLRDLSISRPTTAWGVPVPWDPKHVIYVWVDALLNYISAPGFGVDRETFDRVWPADAHVIGKDIIRFHAVIWPAMLMAAGVELPRTVLAHGFLNMAGEKMSKTRGTVVAPQEVLDRFGVDAYRYHLLREVPFGQDGNFSWESMAARYNAELANGLGNLASRVLAMNESYFDGSVPKPSSREPSGPLAAAAGKMAERFAAHLDAYELSDGVAALAEFVREANRFLVEVAPWKLAKDEGRRQDLADALYASLEALRLTAVLASPVMPGAAGRLWEQLGIPEPLEAQRIPGAARWGVLEPGTRTRKGDGLFPRLES